MERPTAGVYRNRKNGKVYVAEYVGVRNSTNAQDGQLMVLYREQNRLGTFYVREEQEFLQKFERGDGS